MDRLLPFLRWLPELRRPGVLRRDLVAGVTVAAVLVPQAMAYAELAGLPSVYGLYAAFLPPVIAAFWGSSRHLATGPVAMASLISAATVGSVAAAGTEAYVSCSILLALMVGVLRLALGALRLGMLVNLLSVPVIAGFTNAAALIIASSQLHHLLGVDAEAGSFHVETVWRVLASAADLRWTTVGMAALAAAVLILLRHRFEKVLAAVAVTTALSWAAGFDGEVVGHVPRGLPAFELPAVDPGLVLQLLPGAAVLTLIGLMEAMSIAKTIAARSKHHIDVDQELVGQGLANVAGSLFGSYAVSGSFSRSMVNFTNGAVTGFASAVTSAAVLLTLLVLTPLFHHLPRATLAVIIVAAVAGLVGIKPVRRAWRVSRTGALIAAITFAATLALAPALHWGILIGVALSLLQFLRRTMRPHVAYLARHPEGHLVDADAHGLALGQRIAILRFDGGLYFGDAGWFEDKVLEALSRLPQLRYLVFDAGGINEIDVTGVEALRRAVEELRGVGVEVHVTRVKHGVYQVLESTGLADEIGASRFHDWNQHALEELWDRMEPSYRDRCPLNVATPQNAGEGP